jgi:hypothetical protein
MKKKEQKSSDKHRNEEDKKKEKLPYNPEITNEDMQALNEKGHSMNMGRDKELANREREVDFTAKDMDIPGRDERDTSTGKEIPDEDNYQFNQRRVRPDEQKKSEHPNPDSKIPKD